MMRELRRFAAKSDAGQAYTVVEYGRVVEHRPTEGPRTGLIGGLEYYLEDGSNVSATSEAGVFRIFDTDEIIREV